MQTEDVKEMLRERGIQPTAQRVEIASVLLARCQHLSADQLRGQLAARGSAVSKATIYNTLNLFARHGLVREVIVDASKVFYDSNTAPHHHLFNTDDGVLIDVEEESVGVTRLPALPEGTVSDGVDVIVRIRNAEVD